MKVVGRMMVRGMGSTLKRKNAYPILGKPMIWWTLSAAKEAGWIDDIFVWTEDEELAGIAGECGCSVLRRTKDQLFYHGGVEKKGNWLRHYDEMISAACGGVVDVVVNLNCNLCLLTADILEEMFKKLVAHPTATKIFPVTKVRPNLYTKNPTTGTLFPVFADSSLPPEEFPDLYRFGGTIIVHWERAKRMKIPRRFIYHEVSPEYLVDVHDLDDVRLAEYYLMRRLGGRVELPARLHSDE